METEVRSVRNALDALSKEPVLLYRVEIPGRVAIKKNGQTRRFSPKAKRMVPCPNEKYIYWESVAATFMAREKRKFDTEFPMNFPLHLKMTFFLSNHQSEPDLSNCYEGPQDALKRAGVIVDDKLVRSHDGSRKVFGQGPARVVVEIYRFKELAE